MRSPVVVIRVRVDTGLQGSERTDEIEIDRAEWESWSEDKQEAFARDCAFEFVEWSWGIVPE